MRQTLWSPSRSVFGLEQTRVDLFAIDVFVNLELLEIQLWEVAAPHSQECRVGAGGAEYYCRGFSLQYNPSTGLHRHCQLQPPTITMLIEVDFERSDSTSHITFTAIKTKTLAIRHNWQNPIYIENALLEVILWWNILTETPPPPTTMFFSQ